MTSSLIINKKPKVFALYLPQFHRTKENDLWWGEGFTEWDTVRSAKKLSCFSRQPRIPLEGYYDLSNAQSIARQAELAISHNISGFAIYHYYSKGKILLGKPVELLKSNKDINIQYFFSWANHDWRRTWYGYNMEILSKQLYDEGKGLIEHFNYLLPFFQDVRYLKIDNKPVFCIYKSSYVPNLQEYIECWNQLAQAAGYNGIFWIQTLDTETCVFDKCSFDASFEFEPGFTASSKQMHLQRSINRARSFFTKKLKVKKVANVFDYERVAQLMCQRQHSGKHQFFGVFPGWDNTPRHKYMGTVYRNDSLKCFEELFREQYKKAYELNQELLFVNSWNEWSEGAYLEPDTDNKYEYLEIIKKVVDQYE